MHRSFTNVSHAFLTFFLSFSLSSFHTFFLSIHTNFYSIQFTRTKKLSYLPGRALSPKVLPRNDERLSVGPNIITSARAFELKLHKVNQEKKRVKLLKMYAHNKNLFFSS